MTLPFTAHAKAADLASGLRFVAVAVAKRPPVALLAGVLLTASEDGITLSAYDYEVSATITIPGSGEGTALVHHAQFTAVMKAFGKNDTISMDADFADGMHLNSDGFGATVEQFNSDDYPTLPVPDVNIAVLTDTSLLADVLTAACKDVTLPVLNAVQIRTYPDEGRVTMAATDRYRLVEAESKADFDLLVPVSVVVPWRACAHVAKSFKGDVQLCSTDGVIGFADHASTVTVRTIDSEFPRYQSLIPSEAPAASVQVDSGAMIAATKRVAATLGKLDLARGVPCALEPGAATVGALVVPGHFDGEKSFDFRIAPDYAISALTAVGPGEVTVSAFSPKPEAPLSLRPIMFTGSRGVRAIVMPIRPGAE